MNRLFFGAKLHRLHGWSKWQKVVALAGAVIAAVAISGGAFAFMLALGHGSGTYTSQQSVAAPQTVTLTVTATPATPTPITQDGNGVADDAWRLGDLQAFSISVKNDSTSPVSLTGPSPFSGRWAAWIRPRGRMRAASP